MIPKAKPTRKSSVAFDYKSKFDAGRNLVDEDDAIQTIKENARNFIFLNFIISKNYFLN